jgi:hypothetical protein
VFSLVEWANLSMKEQMLHHKRKLEDEGEGEGFGVEAAGGASLRPEQRGECKSAGKDCQPLEEGQQTSR